MHASVGFDDPIEGEARGAAMRICYKPSTMGELSEENSSIIFLRRRPGSVNFVDAEPFIPTPHLINIFEKHHHEIAYKESLLWSYALSPHALTKASADWAHEKLTHDRLGLDRAVLKIFRDTSEKTIQPSSRLLSGTLTGLEKAGVSDSFYWIPSVVNIPGVDGVLGNTDGHVYTIQATLSNEPNSPIEGIKKVWAQFTPEVQTGRTWHHVVVTNTNSGAVANVEKLLEPLSNLTLPFVQVWGCVLSRW
jgi:hypothetical protein